MSKEHVVAFGRIHTPLGQAAIHKQTLPVKNKDYECIVVENLGESGDDGVRITIDDIVNIANQNTDAAQGNYHTIDVHFTPRKRVPNDRFRGTYLEGQGETQVAVEYKKRNDNLAFSANCAGLVSMGVQHMVIKWLYQGEPQFLMSYPSPAKFPANGAPIFLGTMRAGTANLAEDNPPNTFYVIVHDDGTFGVGVDFRDDEGGPTATAASLFTLPTGTKVPVDLVLVCCSRSLDTPVSHKDEASIALTAANMEDFVIYAEPTDKRSAYCGL